MKLSLIVPVFNGARTIKHLVDAVENEMRCIKEWEIILVNDGSPADNSGEVCANLAQNDAHVKFLDLALNFGEHNAVLAGLNACSGDVAVILDDDFQNPPSEILKLAAKMEEGYDVVFTSYISPQQHFWRRLGSRFTNLFASVLIHKPLNLYLSSFKALNRFVIDQVIQYKGPYPYLDGLILRVTRNYSIVSVRHDPRREGRSGYTLLKLCLLWSNVVTNFSIVPLRLATLCGFVFAALGMVGATLTLAERLENPRLPIGWASLMIVVLITSGVQMVLIGMLGEYLGRLFLHVSGRPQFIIRRTINCDL